MDYSDISDQRLLELYKEADLEAFNEIYRRHKDKVYGYLAKRVPNNSLVEEIYQEVFLKLHRSRHSCSLAHPLLKWIYVITRSVMLDYLKRKELPIADVEPEAVLEFKQPEARSEMDIDAVAELNEKEREALKLKFFADKDYQEMASELNMTQQSVRKVVSRAIKKLRLKFGVKST